MTQLRQEMIVDGYKLFVKAVILQVNGMASSTNTLWAVDGQARDMNLSVSWYLPLSHTHTLTHSHTLLITCTCCYDEVKGTQDQDFSCSFSDSLSLILCAHSLILSDSLSMYSV